MAGINFLSPEGASGLMSRDPVEEADEQQWKQSNMGIYHRKILENREFLGKWGQLKEVLVTPSCKVSTAAIFATSVPKLEKHKNIFSTHGLALSASLSC